MLADEDDTEKLLAALDELVMEAIGLGSVFWRTKGRGGDEPRRPYHDFMWNSVLESARADMYRGTDINDNMDVVWNLWYNGMARYRSWTYKTFRITNSNETANSMEMIAGISYATACEGKNLREGQSFEFPSEDSKLCWTRAWKVFEKLGLSDKPPEPEATENRFTMSMDTYLSLIHI